MKIKIFYSWQSDLPNKTNRGFIESCLEKVKVDIFKANNKISEIIIDSDSRDESGTPDLVNTIFSKIDQCDIFIADISIINSDSQRRKVPNPNVLIELGYATSKIGWEKTLCVYNTEYGKIEDLPFDIRHRKPISYNSTNKNLTKILGDNIQNIIDNYISNKNYYNSLKREIDLSLQAILISISRLIYFREVPKCYDYNRILHLTKDDLVKELKDKKFIGFLIFSNNQPNLDELMEFFNNGVYINFLSSFEKQTLSKVILQIRNLYKVLANEDIYQLIEKDNNLIIVDGHKMNPENKPNSYILLEKIENKNGIVLEGGNLIKSKVSKATTYFRIKEEYISSISSIIHLLAFEVNNWIRISGNYFIYNERLINNKN